MYQEEVKSAIILLYLGILAGMDVRKRQISLVLTGVLFLAGIGWQILVEQTSWLEWLLSLLPGAGFLTLSYISREQVGYGDGLLLLTVGIWLGFGQTFTSSTNTCSSRRSCCCWLNSCCLTAATRCWRTSTFSARSKRRVCVRAATAGLQR